jgi:phospholipid-binding lipoprotein MlaA
MSTTIKFSLITLLTCLLLSGCARGPNPIDPFEHYNRNTYRLNEKLDNNFVKPVAEGYHDITPYFIRKSISNIFSNANETVRMGNDLLQGQVYWFFNDTWRLIINSTVGLLGIFDVASEIGLKKHTNRFSFTLNTWGYTKQPYLIIPFMGPNTTGGAIGLPVDYALAPWLYSFHSNTLAKFLFALQLINARAMLLDQDDLTAQLSFDPYIFMRSAFLQNRAYLIKQNNYPPLQNTAAAMQAEQQIT